MIKRIKSYLKFILPAFLSIVLVAVISIFFPAHISDSNAVRIDATPTTSHSIQITISNNSSSVITFPNDYHVEVNSILGWRKLASLSSSFTSLGHSITPGESSSFFIDYEPIYGTLSPGEYRFVKEVIIADESAYFAGYFSVK